MTLFTRWSNNCKFVVFLIKTHRNNSNNNNPHIINFHHFKSLIKIINPSIHVISSPSLKIRNLPPQFLVTGHLIINLERSISPTSIDLQKIAQRSPQGCLSRRTSPSSLTKPNNTGDRSTRAGRNCLALCRESAVEKLSWHGSWSRF